MTEVSSFGPGWFAPYDMKVHLNSDEIGDVDVFDPSDAAPRRFEFYGDGGDYGGGDYGGGTGAGGGNGVFESESHGVIKKLSMLDASGNPVANRASAEKVVIENWSGNQFEFEVFLQEQVVGGSGGDGGSSGDDDYGDYGGGDYGGGGSGGSVDNDLYEARLVQIRNRDGKSLDITYKTFTESEYTVSPERHWQIDTVTDSSQQSISFDYAAQQVGGRWVVEQIHLPGNKTIDFDYTSDKLSKVTRPDGSESNFTTSFDSSIQHVVMDFDDPAAVETPDRAKKVWTTSNFVEIGGSSGSQTGFFNQASQLTRAIIDSNDDVAFSQMSQGGGTGQQWVYEGGGVLKRTYNGIESRYATAWELAADSNGQMIVNASYEDTYATARNTHGDYAGGRPIAIVDSAGVRRDFEYDNHGFVDKITFGDYSDERVTYNDNHQVVRFTDREGYVEKYTYDAQGHRLTKEVGLVGNMTNPGNQNVWPPVPPTYQDIPQPEHAIFQWAYYPVGHANEGVLKTAFDPSWDGSSTDTHRTDYEYDSSNRVTKVLESASVSGGDRPEWNYTYVAGLISSITNPSGHTTSYEYDVNNRLTRTTFNDGSTQESLYGAPNTAAEGLVVATKDRRNVVTTFSYDNDGRLTQAITAAARDANLLDGNPHDTPITDRNQQSIATMTYEVGVTSPSTVVRDGSRADYVYDYRGRVIETKVYPYANKVLSSKIVYQDNRKFSDEDPYGRKTFYGYRASDGAMVRVIKGAYPSFTRSSNQAVMASVRDTNLNPAFTVKDMVKDLSGNQVSMIDERGTIHTSEFNTRGQVVREKKAVGTPVEAITEMDYDEDGNVVEIRSPRYFDSTDTNGYQKCKTVMTYDGQGRVLSRTEAPGTPEAATESYAYDSEGRQVTRTDARGKIWTTTYASCCGHSVSSKNPLGHGTVSNKDNGGLVTHTAGIGDVDRHTSLLDPIDAKTLRETTTRYDALGRSVAACTWLVPQGIIDSENPPMAGFDGISGQDGLTSQTLYDADLTDGIGLDSTAGVTVTNPLGGTFTVSLSAALTKMAEPITQGGANTTFDADATGSAVVNLNAENEVSFSISDAQGRGIISGTQHPHDPLPGYSQGDLLTWSCKVHDTTEQLGNGETVVTSMNVDALGHTTKARRNALGLTVESIDQLNFVSTVKYDAAGNSIETRDPNNTGYDLAYDELNRTTSQTDMVGSQTQSVYNKMGHEVTQIDARGNSTTHQYDPRGNRTQTTDRIGGVVQFTHDAAGNKLSVTDAELQTTAYEYDDRGLKIRTIYPDHQSGSAVGTTGYGITECTYDAVNRRDVCTDQLGDTKTFNYDLAGRLLARDYRSAANSPSGTIADTDSFTYDRQSRMLTATSGRYSNVCGMSYNDSGQTISESLTVGGQTYTTTSDYDIATREMQITYPDGTVLNRSYTDRNHLATLTYGGNLVETRSYDNGTRLTDCALGNGITDIRSYNSDNRLAAISSSNSDIGIYNYTWDANKNKTSETITGPLSAYSFTTGPTGYDDQDRLVTYDRGPGTASPLAQQWNLSLEGDWTTFTEKGVVQNRIHGPTHEVNAMDTATVTHDVKGNVTIKPSSINSADTSTLNWDFDNRLTSVDTDSDGTLDATYTYDATGRRVSRNTTVFVCNSQQVMAEYSLGTAATSPTEQYVYGTYIDEPVIKDGTGGLTYYHGNQQHSIVGLTDAVGNMTEHYAYDAYGNAGILAASLSPLTASAVGNMYAYTGRRYEPETGDYFFRARYYSSRLGRFLGRDPLGDVDGMSMYRAYFAMNGMDPSGKRVVSCIAIGPHAEKFHTYVVVPDTYKGDPCSVSFNPEFFSYPVQVPLNQREIRITAMCNTTDCGCSKKSCDQFAIQIMYAIQVADKAAIGNIGSLAGLLEEYDLGPYGGRCHYWSAEFLKSINELPGIPNSCLTITNNRITLDASEKWGDHSVNVIRNKCTGSCQIVDDGFWGALKPPYDPCDTKTPPLVGPVGQREWDAIRDKCGCK